MAPPPRHILKHPSVISQPTKKSVIKLKSNKGKRFALFKGYTNNSDIRVLPHIDESGSNHLNNIFRIQDNNNSNSNDETMLTVGTQKVKHTKAIYSVPNVIIQSEDSNFYNNSQKNLFKKHKGRQQPQKKLNQINHQRFNEVQMIPKNHTSTGAETQTSKIITYVVNRPYLHPNLDLKNKIQNADRFTSNNNTNTTFDLTGSRTNSFLGEYLAIQSNVINKVYTANGVVTRGNKADSSLRGSTRKDEVQSQKYSSNCLRKRVFRDVSRCKPEFKIQAMIDTNNEVTERKHILHSPHNLTTRPNDDRLTNEHNAIAAALLENPSNHKFSTSSGNTTSALRHHMSKMTSSISGHGDVTTQREELVNIPSQRYFESIRENSPFTGSGEQEKCSISLAKGIDLSDLRPVRRPIMAKTKRMSSSTDTCHLINQRQESISEKTHSINTQKHLKDTKLVDEHNRSRLNGENTLFNKTANHVSFLSEPETEKRPESTLSNNIYMVGAAPPDHQQALDPINKIVKDLSNELLYGILPKTSQERRTLNNGAVNDEQLKSTVTESIELNGQNCDLLDRNDNKNDPILTIQNETSQTKENKDGPKCSSDCSKSEKEENEEEIPVASNSAPLTVVADTPRQGEPSEVSRLHDSAMQIFRDITEVGLVSELLRKHSEILSESLRQKLDTVFPDQTTSSEVLADVEESTGPEIPVIDANDVIEAPVSLSRFRHLGLIPVTPPSIDDIPKSSVTISESPPQDSFHQSAKTKEDELIRRAKSRVLRMRKFLPKKNPAKLCFVSTLENSVTHREVKLALEKVNNIRVTCLQYDPVYIEKCGEDGYKGMWIFELSHDSDRKGLLRSSQVCLKGEQVTVRALDDVHMDEYRAFKMYNSVKQEQLQKRLTKPDRKTKKRKEKK